MRLRLKLYNLGMRETELDVYQTDLYVLKNTISESFIKSYEFKERVKTFISEIDGKMWYCIPYVF